MNLANVQKRLKHLRLKYVFFPKMCSCCKKTFNRTKMWRVRAGSSATHNLIEKPVYYYCIECKNSIEAALHARPTASRPKPPKPQKG